ncbi:hypothetical protein CGRA01v4_02708 [Colletotrichum graminicola]|uniref:HNH nuclease domain-containing protein n=1 Tax=Colletotrichum graminicola (strain M1.001 / M2 / FGSC 10212) TaxID=645133 RepID=E3Q424_COLGM|nr:uncharacterized protein GLRG_00480 [Colletotrichum graminicola M1.001]EFQ25336.1 hypothetical protein GLRG_00480 [Colletotrichum graminicola M1.001]WDK11429.1 hypothetical protein CGRA01v4_02708 [Colletotrichum graminicola]
MASSRRPQWSTVLNSVKKHPLTLQELEDSHSDLSSALPDPDDYMDLMEVTGRILELYSNISQDNDTTCQVLRTFQSELRKRGRLVLMTEIKTIGTDKPKLASLARYLSDNILKPPTDFINDLAATVESWNRNRQSTLKQDILKRDGFRCAFSHIYDSESAEDGLVQPYDGARIAETELAHIMPIGLSQFNEADDREKEAVASIWNALYRYFPELKDRIGPEDLNQHANLITFEHSDS